MAQVPYTPYADVSGIAPSSATQNINPSAAAFGGAVAGATQKLGGDLEKTGSSLEQTALMMQDFNNKRDAQQADIASQADMTKLYTAYATKEGKEAADAFPDFQQDVASMIERHAETLTSPMAQQAYRASAMYSARRLLDQARFYAGQQLKKSWLDTNKAQSEQALSLVPFKINDYVSLQKDANQFGANAASDLLHRDALANRDQLTAAEQVAKGHYWHSAIMFKLNTSLENGGGAAAAQALYDRVKDQMDAQTSLQVMTTLRPVVRRAEAEEQFGRLMSDITPGNSSGGAPGTPAANGQDVRQIAASTASTVPGVNVETLVKTAYLENPDSNPNAVSSAGARGRMQFMPATAKQYGVNNPEDLNESIPGAAKLQVDNRRDLTQLLGRVPTEAEVSLAHEQGAGGAAKLILHPNLPATVAVGNPSAITGNGGSADMSAADFVAMKADRFNKAPGLAGGNPNALPATMPDRSQVEQKILTATAGDPEMRQELLTQSNMYFSRLEIATASERKKYDPGWQHDIETDALSGEVTEYPEDRIRAIYQPEDAERMITRYNIAKVSGEVLRGLTYASPEDISRTIPDLATGTGLVGQKIDLLLSRMKGKGTAAVPGGAGEDPGYIHTSEQRRMRDMILNKLREQLTLRQQTLDTDAATYMRKEPTVAAAIKLMDPAKPDTFQNYANATLGAQTVAGVPEERQHILGASEAAGATAAIMKPNADAKTQFDQLQQAWGPRFPQIVKDMVTLGKLPQEFAAITQLDPENAAYLARGLRDQGADGKSLEHMLPLNADGKSPAIQIREDIGRNYQVDVLKKSLQASGASSSEVLGVQRAIETLAYAKKMYHPESDSVNDAVKAFTDKFEFGPQGTWRIPKPYAPATQAVMAQTVDDMKPSDIQIPPEFSTGGHGAVTPDDYLRGIKAHPIWITKNGSVQLLDYMMHPVIGANGQPVTRKFTNEMPAGRMPTAMDMIGQVEVAP